MWSGSMPSQGEPFSSQMVGSWALNPSMPYMNIPHEQVDWASLAQQWIKMKEEVPQFEKEGGEAPMDITKEEALTPPNPPEWPSTTPADGTWNGNWMWNQAGGGWCWSPAAPHISKPTTASTYTSTYATISDVSAPIIPQSSAFPYTPPAAPNSTETFPPTNTYWNSSSAESKDDTWDSNRTQKKHVNVEPTPELDAAKRKQLPAWIREGLEKMEREKLKKAEHERLEKLRKDELARQSELSVVDSNGLVEGSNPPKSKFETESDDSDPGEVEPTEVKIKPEEKPRKSRFDWQGSVIAPPTPRFRSKEQILQAVMEDVRKILTHLLMEVTSEEMMKIAEEEVKHLKRKAPATTVRKTAALTSLTGKLGLGIYESDSESESDVEEKVKNGPDSDQELRERIEKLRNEFVSVEKAIEMEAAEQEERERKQLRHEPFLREETAINHEEQVQLLREDSVDTKTKADEHKKDVSDQRRTNRLGDSSSKSEHAKESSSSSISNNNSSKSTKKLASNDRSHRRDSSSSSSSTESTSSSSSSSTSVSSSSRYRRRRDIRRRKGSERRNSRYTRSRSRSRSRTRRDSSRHRSECRRRSRRSRTRSRSRSRDRKGRSRRSSSSSSNGRHRSRKSNHRR